MYASIFALRVLRFHSFQIGFDTSYLQKLKFLHTDSQVSFIHSQLFRYERVIVFVTVQMNLKSSLFAHLRPISWENPLLF